MRRGCAVIVLLALVISMSGCNLVSPTYSSVVPHQGGAHSAQSGQQIASSYQEIYSALSALISHGEASGVIILNELSEEEGHAHFQKAVNDVMQLDPVGAYAVETIRYDLGTNAGRMAAAVQVDYSRSHSDIISIETVDDMQQAQDLIGQSLEKVADSVVFRVRQYSDVDFEEVVRLYALQNPSMVMEVPRVMSAVYPHSGQERLVELSFTYQNTRDDLLKMQALVRPVFTAAELYVQGEASVRKKFQQLHSFLMERSDYRIRTSVTATYSLLQEGVGDSNAFACVYAAMCRQSGLECRMITGTKNGQPWSWNRVVINNRVYYIDLIESERVGKLVFSTASEMTGYIWER